MTLSIFLFVGLFLVGIQASMPYLLKKTLVFGVTIPTPLVDESTLSSYKKYYSIITAVFGALSITIFTIWALTTEIGEETLVLTGTAIQFAILLLSMSLYFLFHVKTANLKKTNNWGTDLKQIRITDLTVRTADEMLHWVFFTLPILITVGLIAYSATQYANLPELIPTHWGIDGQPDAFSKKTPFSALSLLLILFVLQVMMLAINELTKKSGIKISATAKNKTRTQQLAFRKYTSWLLFAIMLIMTILFSFLQLGMIHEKMNNPFVLFILPIGFLVVIFVLTGVYAFKLGQSGTRLDVDTLDEEVEGVTDYDDDQYWKGGLFYINKNDPSIFVEKRFGVGWTLNFGQPLGFVILFGPIALILLFTFLL
ncbi:DUF1648 domain-containing protein [Sporosarcina sp. CAU 1771]